MQNPEIVHNLVLEKYFVKQDGVTLGGFHEKKYAQLFLDALPGTLAKKHHKM